MALEGKTLIYIVAFEDFFKVGITSSTIAKRLKAFPPYKILLEAEVYTSVARTLERDILSQVKQQGLDYPKAPVPSGHTECFLHEDPELTALLEYANKYIGKFNISEQEYNDKFSHRRAYTNTEREKCKDLIAQGKTLREVSIEVGIPTGTLYRWNSEWKSQQAQQADPSGVELLRLREVNELLHTRVEVLEGRLDEIYIWATRQIRSEQKR